MLIPLPSVNLFANNRDITSHSLLVILLLLFIQTINCVYNPPHYPLSNKTASRFNFSDVDVWIEFEEAAREYGAIDFGFGLASYFPPAHLMDALDKMRNSKDYRVHQYTRTRGYPRLVKALGALYTKLMNRTIDPWNEVIVTTGAMQAIRFIIQAFVNPGEELIVFEPFYHAYHIMITLSGAVPVYVPFRTRRGVRPNTTADLTFDPLELESKITNKTKLILVNNPNNPTGKMFSREELDIIAGLQKKYDLIVIADEVAQFYELEDDRPHVRYAMLPDVWSRTITVNSGGKTFANTGWRVGWCIGPPELLWAISVDVFANVIGVSTPMQEAFAIGIEVEVDRFGTNSSYFEIIKQEAKSQRNKMLRIFEKAGIETIIPESGYFLNANFYKILPEMDMSSVKEARDGFQVAMWLLKEKKIFSMPGNLFYSDEHRFMGTNLTRLCFLKCDSDIEALDKAFSSLKKSSFQSVII